MLSNSHYINQCAVTKGEGIEFDCQWTISNFSTALMASEIKSPSFASKDGQIMLSLLLWPKFNETNAAMALWVQLDKSDKTLRGRYQMDVEKADGKKVRIGGKDFERFKSGDSMATYIEKSKVIDSYMVDNCLKISLTVVIYKGYDQIFVDLSRSEETLPGLKKDFQDLLKSEELCDVTLCASGREFKVHKIILAARSPVFKSMFSHDLKETKSGRVEIPDVDPVILQEMIEFIYTGDTSMVFNPSETTKREADTQLAIELLRVADKYQIQQLKEVSERYLGETLSVESAQDILAVAKLHNSTRLRDSVSQFMREHSAQIIEQMINNGTFLSTYGLAPVADPEAVDK